MTTTAARSTDVSWRLFCFGLGYVGRALARAWLQEGWEVAGTCRSAEKAEQLRRDGIEAVVFDGEEAASEVAYVLSGTTHLLNSAPPGEQGDAVLTIMGRADPPRTMKCRLAPDRSLTPTLSQRARERTCFANFMVRLHATDLEHAAGELQWAGYLSTTGAYGDCAGDWIDETRDPAPLTGANQRRLDAEQAWLGFGEWTGVPTHIFRLPGIYGPEGRNVLESLRAGHVRRIVKPGQVFNRIHVADLISVLMASMARPKPGAIYNVADDEPAPADVVLSFAADLLAIAPPIEEPFADADLSPFARHFYAESRRVRNQRIKEELGVSLRYPSYREGLQAIARSDA